ncbi:MAG: S24 family peptidase [Methylococcaceae bacterium]
MIKEKSKSKIGRREKPSELEDFRRIFNDALDDIGAPALFHGRHKWLAERYGVSNSSARKWSTGECYPDMAHLMMIADDLKYSIDQLVGRMPIMPIGKGKKQDTTVAIRIAMEKANESSNEVDSVKNGHVVFEGDIVNQTMRMNRNGVEIIIVQSDAMADTIQAGDLAFVDTLQKELSDNQIFMFKTSNGTAFRRVITALDGTIQLICDNTKYPTTTINRNEIGLSEDKQKDFKLLLVGKVNWIIKRVASDFIG